jgi:multisubunit Na+/H+ antiporter MnhG subunit
VSGIEQAISDLLVAAGTIVIVASCLGALLASDALTRLHYATPITSFGGPLVAAGLCVVNGVGLTTASIALPVALLFFTAPILSAAIGRTIAQREGKIEAGSPE